ncbi:MAG: hypothetical protein J0I32_05295 [Sphingobacteriales bacterium]|nr:hypothetical protein [Sphingobacteriales bacterium]
MSRILFYQPCGTLLFYPVIIMNSSSIQSGISVHKRFSIPSTLSILRKKAYEI